MLKIKSLITSCILYSLCFTITASVYYVAPYGDDSNPGTLDLPWGTWGKAFMSVNPGDIVYFRGGVYYMDIPDGIGYTEVNSGSEGNIICFWAYPDEVPVLDCDLIIPSGLLNFAIRAHNTSYVHYRGLTIRNVWSVNPGVECVAMRTGGDGVIIERCTIYNVHGVGFQCYGGNERYINCDAYSCCDSLATGQQLPGNRGTGFAVLNNDARDKPVYYNSCRAWDCGDQGFSGHSVSYVEWNQCWSFRNGQMKGGGHGWKIGYLFHDIESLPLQRVIKNCLAAYNRESGFTTNDRNQASQSSRFLNNTAYHNGHYPEWPVAGFGFIIYDTEDPDQEELARVLINNLSYSNERGPIFVSKGALYSEKTNSWNNQIVVNDDDFISIDSTGLSGPRKPDGSLPDIDFLKLDLSSDLINAGTDVGIPFYGFAPDLGFAEAQSDPVSPFGSGILFPNPNNGLFSIEIFPLIPEDEYSVKVVNAEGKEIYQGVLKNNTMDFDFSKSASGIYFLIISNRDRLVLLKKFIIF